MSHSPRLLVAISAHGLGHLGQAAPVCQALQRALPHLQLVVWSDLPTQTLQRRIPGAFQHIRQPCDIGFVMHDALRVDIPGSWAKYRAREAAWSAHLSIACDVVRNVKPDLVLSDVGELPLAAAQSLGIPDVAMSSLNWADLATHYFAELDDAHPVLSRLRHIYDHTCLAIRLTPGMPMRGRRECIVPPVAAISTQARPQLRAQIKSLLPPALRKRPLLLIGMGGIETSLPLATWPEQTEITFLVATQRQLSGNGLPEQGIINADWLQEASGLRFTDLLTASDAILCKPGYGTFTEAALAGIPLLYVPRTDWPEQEILLAWLHANTRCAALCTDDLMRGHLRSAFHALLSQPVSTTLPRNGADIAATEILRLLDARLSHALDN